MHPHSFFEFLSNSFLLVSQSFLHSSFCALFFSLTAFSIQGFLLAFVHSPHSRSLPFSLLFLRIQLGHDADLLVLQKHTLELRYALAHGEVVKTPTFTKRSKFAEPAPPRMAEVPPSPASASGRSRTKQKPNLDDVPDHQCCD